MPEIPSDHWLLNPSGDDAAIVEMFREWQAATRHADELGLDEATAEARFERECEIESRIVAAPAQGAAGMAVKAMLVAVNDRVVLNRALLSLVAHGPRFVPELAPLAAQILAESAADMASYEARAADMASYEAGAATPPPPASMAELHRRWAALVDERTDLGLLEGDANIIADADGRVGVRWYKETARRQGPVLYSDEEIAAEAHRRRSAVWVIGDDERIECERIERDRIKTREALAAYRAEAARITALGGPAAVAARFAAVGDEIDALLDVIEAQPARTPYDVAVLLDIALEYGDSPCCLSDVFWAIEAQRAVAALAPGFRFTFYDRYFERVERDVVGLPTEAAVAADCAPAPADVLPAEGLDEQPSPTLVRREAGETAELVRQAAALAADYAGPLPAGPGDAGLVEAERRRDALIKGITALSP